MNPVLAAALIVVLVLVAIAVGIVTKRRSSRKRRVTVAEVTPADIDLETLGDVATVVQLSTEFCARCPGVHRALVSNLSGVEDVVYTDVDLTHRPQLASQLRVLQTPTVLVVDAQGRVAARYAGAVSPMLINQEIDALRRGADVAFAR
ncbi:thioredoxin-like negative regulator of GroEL [Microbacterium endophyticum]|uniref:Thioredoxin-like negative regulator of GroEL n=1 Tax=Microbacterium endophyticum TaxID=1526412 RepID=A0A7W4V1N0_9MICO|nr:thioredoxin domain-containing protein [Microbacterium endophyticum]MBB2975180.1 thioredoxin-like negative regulator of GroEL [Microbacterium endophyticum]NIK37608.1 thioredoxin-like negative regulator of GroEL [Microbacterium endophyticum]